MQRPFFALLPHARLHFETMLRSRSQKGWQRRKDNVKNEIIAIGESTARILQIKKRENKNPKQKSCKKSLGAAYRHNLKYQRRRVLPLCLVIQKNEYKLSSQLWTLLASSWNKTRKKFTPVGDLNSWPLRYRCQMSQQANWELANMFLPGGE